MEGTNGVRVEVRDLVVRAEGLVIQSDEDCEMAAGMLRELAAGMRRVDEVFDPIIKKANAAHKEAIAKKREIVAPLLKGDRRLRDLVGDYRSEQERRRKAEEQERRRKAQAEEEERRLTEAADLEASGQTEEAEAVLERPMEVAVPLPPPPPKMDGVAVRMAWTFQIVDAKKIERDFLMPDEVKIGRLVRAIGLRARAMVGEGIEVYEKSVVVVRGPSE